VEQKAGRLSGDEREEFRIRSSRTVDGKMTEANCKTTSARVYHGVVVSAMLIIAILVIFYGWKLRKIVAAGSPDFSGGTGGGALANRVLAYVPNAFFVFGSIVLLTAVLGAASLVPSRAGKVFRITYGILGALLVLAFIGLATAMFYYLRLGYSYHVGRSEWEKYVKEESDEVCDIEEQYKCRGLHDNDCKNCRLGVESTCTENQKLSCAPCSGATKDNTSHGCMKHLYYDVLGLTIKIGSVAVAVAVLILIDLFLLCLLA
jgi:hypothetical protein